MQLPNEKNVLLFYFVYFTVFTEIRPGILSVQRRSASSGLRKRINAGIIKINHKIESITPVKIKNAERKINEGTWMRGTHNPIASVPSRQRSSPIIYIGICQHFSLFPIWQPEFLQ